MSEVCEQPAGKLLLKNLIDNDFESLVNTLRANIYKSEPVISPCTIMLSLSTGYALAKRIYLKLRDDGYLNEENRLIYQSYHFPDQLQSKTEQRKRNIFLNISSALPLNKDLIANCLYPDSNSFPEETIYPLFTEIPFLDRITEGFDEGSLNLLVTAQETETTRFSLDLALRIAEYNLIHQPVLYVSLDKSLSDIGLQFCFTTAKLSPEDYAKKKISLQQYRHLCRHLSLLSFPDGRSRLFLDEGHKLTVMQLKEKIISAMDECRGLSGIIVDAIDLIENASTCADRSPDSLSELIDELSYFAAMLKVPVIAALHLSKFKRNSMQITSYEDFSKNTGIMLSQKQVNTILLLETTNCFTGKRNEISDTLTVLKNDKCQKILV